MDEHGCDIGEAGTKFDTGVRKLYRSYIKFENAYRELYRRGLNRKISELNGCLESLEEIWPKSDLALVIVSQTMETLLQLIDKNSHLIPEGDYLKMCNILKEFHAPQLSAPMFKKFEVPLEMGIVRYFYTYFNSRLATMDITFNEATLDLLDGIAQKMESQQPDVENAGEKHMRTFFSIPDTVTDLRTWADEQGKDYDGMISTYTMMEDAFKVRVQNGISTRAKYFFKNVDLSQDYYL